MIVDSKARYGDWFTDIQNAVSGSSLAQQIQAWQAKAKELEQQVSYWKDRAEQTYDTVGTLVNDPLGEVQEVTIESRITPKISVFEPLRPDQATSGSGSGDIALRRIRPKVTVKFRSTDKPLVLAPYGEPGGSYWNWLLAGSVFGGVSLLFLAFRGARR